MMFSMFEDSVNSFALAFLKTLYNKVNGNTKTIANFITCSLGPRRRSSNLEQLFPCITLPVIIHQHLTR